MLGLFGIYTPLDIVNPHLLAVDTPPTPLAHERAAPPTPPMGCGPRSAHAESVQRIPLWDSGAPLVYGPAAGWWTVTSDSEPVVSASLGGDIELLGARHSFNCRIDKGHRDVVGGFQIQLALSTIAETNKGSRDGGEKRMMGIDGHPSAFRFVGDRNFVTRDETGGAGNKEIGCFETASANTKTRQVFRLVSALDAANALRKGGIQSLHVLPARTQRRISALPCPEPPRSPDSSPHRQVPLTGAPLRLHQIGVTRSLSPPPQKNRLRTKKNNFPTLVIVRHQDIATSSLIAPYPEIQKHGPSL